MKIYYAHLITGALKGAVAGALIGGTLAACGTVHEVQTAPRASVTPVPAGVAGRVCAMANALEYAGQTRGVAVTIGTALSLTPAQVASAITARCPHEKLTSAS